MTRHRVQTTLLVVGLILCAWPGMVRSQSRPPRDTMVIRRQLESSLELQQRTMALLADQPDEALKTVWEAYVQMRAAHGSMIINASNTKFPDPLFPQIDERINEVRRRILHARDMLRSRSQRRNAIEIAESELTESVRLTRVVLATTF